MPHEEQPVDPAIEDESALPDADATDAEAASKQSQPLDPVAEAEAENPNWQAEARQYGRIQLRLDLADVALDLAYLAVAAFILARPLDAWLSRAIGIDTLRLIALYGAVFALHLLVSLPLSYYSGYVVESRFGLSTLTPGGWLRRYFARMAMGMLFGLALYLGLFWIIWLVGAWWWVAASLAFFVVTVVVGQLAPVLILPLLYKVERFEDADLQERLEALAAGTGLTVEGVYRMGLSAETKKANAMLAGLGHTRRVLLGDTLLDSFTPREIGVVFAHEIGHHVHRHLPRIILMGALVSGVGFFIYDRVAAWWVGVSDFGEVAIPVATLPLLMFLPRAFLLLMEPLQNAMMRHFERQCDWYALKRTDDREAYLSAFRKLAVLNKDDPDPHPLAVKLFHSHPPISQRLAMAEEM